MKLKKRTDPKFVLIIIVLSQFCCTSLWFAGNAVLNDLIYKFSLNDNSLGTLTSSVQLGFITGTLLFAIFTVADRFAAQKVFFTCALLGALCNAAIIFEGNNLWSILSLRYLTGFFLAGIYPVGMKIASDHFKNGLGKAMGFLVGALVLGTAFPYLLSSFTNSFPWKGVIAVTSIIAVFGGTIMLVAIPSTNRLKSEHLELDAFINVFKNKNFRIPAIGYFGHMWELYAFWAFLPLILIAYKTSHPNISLNIPILCFLIIAIGALGCVLGGYISQKIGVKRTAFICLLMSCACCLGLPFFIATPSKSLFIGYLLFWGFMVVADSPLFSTLVAQQAPVKVKGTALTIVNCIGFLITIGSIQLLSYLNYQFNTNLIYMILALGPIVGLIALLKKRNI